ncbi:MAG: hypothetical protein HGB31_07375 [Erysipelotrichaceae bacterium]|jgi:hypothetical protein|nr:hypothetical protein [Erysipelotrichaceae bacterium]
MKQEQYITSLHKLGKRFVIISALLMLAVPLTFSIVYNAWPTLDLMIKGMLSVGAIYIPIAIIETYNYAPMMGIGATYLSNVTGNIANMKLPAALTAIRLAKVESGSDEAEIIATLAVATSSIVTTVIIIVGMLVLLPYISVIEGFLGSLTDYLVPAIFGALGVVFVVRNWKLTIAPFVLMMLLFMFVVKSPTVQPALVPVASVFSIVVARQLFKKGWVK